MDLIAYRAILGATLIWPVEVPARLKNHVGKSPCPARKYWFFMSLGVPAETAPFLARLRFGLGRLIGTRLKAHVPGSAERLLGVPVAVTTTARSIRVFITMGEPLAHQHSITVAALIRRADCLL